MPAHYGTTTAFTGVPPATVNNSTPSATTTKYYAAYAGQTASASSDSHGYDGKVCTESMALNGLQTWARWGYASGDDFFNEPYPQNKTDYFAAKATSYTIAASPTGATEAGNTVTLTTTATPSNAAVGMTVTISGVAVAGYNGSYVVTAVNTSAKHDHLHRLHLRPCGLRRGHRHLPLRSPIQPDRLRHGPDDAGGHRPRRQRGALGAHGRGSDLPPACPRPRPAGT